MRTRAFLADTAGAPSRVIGLASTAVVSGAAFAALAVQTAERKTSYVDGRARAKVPKRKKKETRAVAKALGLLAKGEVQTPGGLLLAAYLARRGATSAAAATAGVAVMSYVLSGAFDRWLPHRTPPPGRRSPTTPSFPSGHTFRATAVVSAAAYLATREGLIDWRVVAAPAALFGPLSGLDRMYLDRHWITDIVAGWLAGVSVAALSAAAYELAAGA